MAINQKSIYPLPCLWLDLKKEKTRTGQIWGITGKMALFANLYDNGLIFGGFCR